MKASVILPAHNRPELYARALASWMNQSERDLEIVVVDDNSHEPVKAPRPRRRGANQPMPTTRLLRLTSEFPIRGPNPAWIAGMEQAKGDIIILTSQDTIVPPTAAQALVEAVTGDPSRRWAIRPAFLSAEMMRHIERTPWRERWEAWGDLPGFWTDPTPYGVPNGAIASGGLHFNATAFTREWYDWIGGLVPEPWYGLNDRDIVERERVLHREPGTVQGLFCVHQYHENEHGPWIRALMAHPGYIYGSEAQARRLPEALPTISPRGAVPTWEMVAEAMEQADPSETGEPADLHRYPSLGQPPSHVVAVFAHVLEVVRRQGWRRVSLTHSGYWAACFCDLARHRGIEAAVGLEPHDARVSLMEWQQLAQCQEAWDLKNAWIAQGKLLALVPYGEHFHGGSNVLQFTEAELQAPLVDLSLTGYLIGVWP